MWRAGLLVIALLALVAWLFLNETAHWIAVLAFPLLVWSAYAAVVLNKGVPALARIALFIALLALCAAIALYGTAFAELIRLIAVYMGAWLIVMGMAHAALAVGRWARPRGLFKGFAPSFILSIVVGVIGGGLVWGFLVVAGKDVFASDLSLLRSQEVVAAFFIAGLIVSLTFTVSGWFGAKHESVVDAGVAVPIPVPLNRTEHYRKR